jgi:hypothetical protein
VPAQSDEPFVLESLRPFEWSSDDAIAFEAAQDVVGRFVAECSARHRAERLRGARPAVLAHWEEQIAVAARDRRALRYDDADGVRATIAEYRNRLEALPDE